MSTASPASTTPVLILGSHLAALGVLRVLARRGVPCFVVDDTTSLIARSRWHRPTTRTLVESADPAALAALLRGLDLPRAVLMPCSDQWALAVAGLPPDLRERFPTSLPPLEAVEQFVDKDRFRALVERLGIAHPRTTLIRTSADLEAVSDDDVRHGFLKPTESHVHNRRFGTKGFFIESREDAMRRVELASRAGITFMLQEWIPGDLGATVLVDLFVDAHGSIAASMARRRVRMDPPRLANTCTDVTIPIEEVAPVMDDLRRLIEATRYRGVLMAEFKRDERDGRYRIIEVNPRPVWFVSHIAAAGLDLPWMSYLDALGQPVPVPGAYEVGRYGRYEILDLRAVFRALGALRRPHGPILAPWLRGDRLLFWWRDPMPAVTAIQQIVEHRLVGVRARTRQRTTTEAR